MTDARQCAAHAAGAARDHGERRGLCARRDGRESPCPARLGCARAAVLRLCRSTSSTASCCRSWPSRSRTRLHITDGQLGLIGGLYFAFFYCFIADPVGWLADRTNRVTMLSLACAIWSAATTAAAWRQTIRSWSLARMTVGFGEAGGVPPSYALITDNFPPGRRGTALGIYNLGPPIGAALGIAFGASIAAAFNWRDAFIAIGAVGLVTAIAVRVIMREPERGATDTASRSGGCRKGALLGHARDVLLPAGAGARRARQRRDPVHHLWPRQFHHAVPDAREGHDARG